jgi:peptide/nickel transport system ATP-binding protein
MPWHSGKAGVKRVNLLEVKGLKTYINTRKGLVRCVDGVDFAIRGGETLGLVGESGSGKTMTARSVMGMIDHYPGIIEGEIWFNKGEDNNPSDPTNLVGHLKETVTKVAGNRAFEKDVKKWNRETKKAYRDIRGRRLSIVFQDPQTSLNPYWTIGEQLGEAVSMSRSGEDLTDADVHSKTIDWLKRVHINMPEQVVNSYPFELSGGMCQRVMIAMAFASEPDLVIADEPTTGLDVTIQARIVDLFEELKEELGLTMLLISHDIGLIHQLADRVAVMYCGRIVEDGPVSQVMRRQVESKHPYSVALRKSLPKLDDVQGGERLPVIKNEVPDMLNPPPGCAFHPRCEMYESDREGLVSCTVRTPDRTRVGTDHWVCCWGLADNRETKE